MVGIIFVLFCVSRTLVPYTHTHVRPPRFHKIRLARHQWNRYVKYNAAIFLWCECRRTGSHFQHNLLEFVVGCRMLGGLLSLSLWLLSFCYAFVLHGTLTPTSAHSTIHADMLSICVFINRFVFTFNSMVFNEHIEYNLSTHFTIGSIEVGTSHNKLRPNESISMAIFIHHRIIGENLILHKVLNSIQPHHFIWATHYCLVIWPFRIQKHSTAEFHSI